LLGSLGSNELTMREQPVAEDSAEADAQGESLPRPTETSKCGEHHGQPGATATLRPSDDLYDKDSAEADAQGFPPRPTETLECGEHHRQPGATATLRRSDDPYDKDFEDSTEADARGGFLTRPTEASECTGHGRTSQHHGQPGATATLHPSDDPRDKRFEDSTAADARSGSSTETLACTSHGRIGEHHGPGAAATLRLSDDPHDKALEEFEHTVPNGRDNKGPQKQADPQQQVEGVPERANLQPADLQAAVPKQPLDKDSAGADSRAEPLQRPTEASESVSHSVGALRPDATPDDPHHQHFEEASARRAGASATPPTAGTPLRDPTQSHCSSPQVSVGVRDVTLEDQLQDAAGAGRNGAQPEMAPLPKLDDAGAESTEAQKDGAELGAQRESPRQPAESSQSTQNGGTDRPQDFEQTLPVRPTGSEIHDVEQQAPDDTLVEGLPRSALLQPMNLPAEMPEHDLVADTDSAEHGAEGEALQQPTEAPESSQQGGTARLEAIFGDPYDQELEDFEQIEPADRGPQEHAHRQQAMAPADTLAEGLPGRTNSQPVNLSVEVPEQHNLMMDPDTIAAGPGETELGPPPPIQMGVAEDYEYSDFEED